MTPKTARLLSWSGDLPELGHYFQTPKGSTYLIIKVTPNTRPNPKSIAKLDLLKLAPEELSDIPFDSYIHSFKWMS